MFFQLLISGLITGSVLALATSGFTLVRKVDNFFNIAHAEMITIGAFFTYFFSKSLHLGFWVGAILGVIVTGIAGVVVLKVFYEPIKRHGSFVLMITSIGVAYLLHGLSSSVFGESVKSFDLSPSSALFIGKTPLINPNQILVVVVAMLCFAGLQIYFGRATTGKALRAIASNSSLANAIGIDSRTLDTYLWFVASVLAGLAGVLMGVIGSVSGDLGWSQILLIVAVAVLAGFEDLWAVVLCALLLGVLMDLSTMFLPSSYRVLTAFAIIMVVVLLRPRGLFARER
ncbi:MAG: branched-chain amino acid ABC transporter permease [Actinobacteria bacterium]|nr:branched-chain amino acid ABC transporter permease [Actinomycetota bacterium]